MPEGLVIRLPLHPAHIVLTCLFHPETSWPSWPTDHPDRLTFSFLEVSLTHPARSASLHPEAFLQRHPGGSFVRNAIILMFISRVGFLSTEIESAIPLRLTTHSHSSV